MKSDTTKETKPRGLWLVAGCIVLLVVSMLIRSSTTPERDPALSAQFASAPKTLTQVDRWRAAHAHTGNAAPTAEEIVAAKLKKFGVKRRALVHELAEHYKIDTLPPDVERFFDALDAGDWEETHRLFRSLRADLDGPGGADLNKYWRAILEAFGAAEQVHLWPAQQLLDYGNGVLNALKPDMVYVGGTDPGCFICTMLNETTDGEQHVTLTQNALADKTYLTYLSAIYGDSLNVPTLEENQNAFDQYVQDETKRAAHDAQFPDEPKQVLPNENVTMVDGKPQVNGQASVMLINNILMQNLLQKNPNLSFAMEESFPLPSTYPGATPLGPILELRAGVAMTGDDAAQAVNYWQNEAQNLQTAGETSDPVLRSYAHDANAEGNLLANNNFPDQAAQAYQTALSIWPGSVEAIRALTRLLAQQEQFDQAGQVLDTFLQNNPQETQIVANLRQTLQGKH